MRPGPHILLIAVISLGFTGLTILTGLTALTGPTAFTRPADAVLPTGLTEPGMRMIAAQSENSIAITNVAVVDVEYARIRRGQTVVISGERIEWVGPVEGVQFPAGATILDGRGRYLSPGLVDMHVHINEEDLSAYLEYGVTTVRNLWGYPELHSLIEQIDSGERIGPNIYAVSPGLDARPQYWPHTQFVESPGDAAAVVQRQVDNGWSVLKLYADLSRASYDAIVEEARKHGLGYGGHVSRKVGILHALESEQQFIEHLTGYIVYLNPNAPRGAFGWLNIDESRIPELVDRTVDAGTWNCPTLAIYSIIARQDSTVRRNRQLFVKALYDGGAPLLIGTDSGIEQTVPGRSLHDEMAEFIEAGISAADVLRIATLEAARFLGEEKEFGRIRRGMRADMILVGGNPLEDPGPLGNPEMVFARGHRVK